MAVYFVTGKLGSGKSLVAVGKIRDYLSDGRRVATNLDLWVDEMFTYHDKSAVRLPDKPRAEDMMALGRATSPTIRGTTTNPVTGSSCWMSAGPG
ncbi:zonular occludens toxin domain-containing protein [Pseudomonas sp. TCU-HL1]|uniref:zonular occludens toxin domain-containing protein n=1 Tax=Pseudomonas sp. TCU-HL1 TaxID=1856685 RepID=UPI00083D8D58|nr:zonular occludens toxin domain-containing protein [Pseudomonas sp. TCU-HL1]AOE85598.1 hypothetical protein THL1_3050 [Pseudomonas sp. TCU-HL1]